MKDKAAVIAFLRRSRKSPKAMHAESDGDEKAPKETACTCPKCGKGH